MRSFQVYLEQAISWSLLVNSSRSADSAASIRASNESQAVQLGTLLVEDKSSPLGIDVIPRFSWILSSDQRTVSQTSYRLLISTQQAGRSDVWDSGIVASNKPYGIEYAGPSLSSDTHYFWTVNVVTTAGSASASSDFSTGLLTPSAWGSSLWIGKPQTDDTVPDAVVASFKAASWIWDSVSASPNSPPGDRAFRYTFTSPPGKTISSTAVLISVDDQYTLYINGEVVGTSPKITDSWKSAQFFNVSVDSTSTVFAVRGTNLPDVSTGGAGPAGLIAGIEITFSDGTTSSISTDSSWKATASIPDNFQLPATDDSQWDTATVIASYGSGPWGTSVVIPTSILPPLEFTNSTWIWSSETNPPEAPAEPRAFRKTFITPTGKSAQSATILITVDDDFTLYVNGALVGSPESADWQTALIFYPSLDPTSNLFAIRADNLPDATSGGESPAGLLAAIRITYTDGSTDTILSDTTWRVNKTVSDGFELPSTDDSTWPNATSQGLYGVSPWGTGVSISDPLGEHPAPLIRKEFTVNQRISYARLYYAAGGYASITINSAPASNQVLSPGFTKYDVQQQYIALDVASLLKLGSNVIGAELGRSHYGVLQGSVWNWNSAPWHAEPSVRIVLSIGYADGTSTRILSDGSWKVTEGPTRLDDVFGGENFDASYITLEWDSPGFDDSSWRDALVMTGPTGVLVHARQNPTRVVESLAPISITQPVSGIYVAAFERVVAGWARLTASGPAKSLITIHFGEKLNPDGTVIYQDLQHYYANNFQTDRFWLAGTGSPETFEPKFSYKGYQYVQIEGWPGSSPPTTSNIVGQVVHDDLGSRGGFTSSNDLLNTLHQASVLTLLNNLHSIPEDCPTFEKNGWSGDAMLGTEMFLINLDAQELLAKYVRDLDESRDAGSTGPPAVIAPDSGWGANNQAPTWHSAFILIPWWLYQYRGDRRVLEEHYTSMSSYIEFELARSPNNIASTGLGDWDTPETSPLGGNPPEDSRVPATAFLYQMLVTMNQIATVLGQTNDANTFASQAADVKTAFNSAFLNSSTGYYTGVGDDGYRQSHNILSLAFGLTPNDTTTKLVADSIAADISARDTHLNTGALSTKHLLPVLSEHSLLDTAFAVSVQTTFPSWGYWIVNGATTTWEHWLLTARSHDHYFLGTYQDWMFKDVAGFQLTSTAFETVLVRPRFTAHLRSAAGWTMTPFGNFSVDWTNSSTSLTLNVGIPVGVNATIIIPAAEPDQVTEGGKALNSSTGVTILGSDGTSVQIYVGSGAYAFSAST